MQIGGSTAASIESSPRDTPVKGRIHRRNERGETPLHLACIRGDESAVLSLIEQGADVNATDNAGITITSFKNGLCKQVINRYNLYYLSAECELC